MIKTLYEIYHIKYGDRVHIPTVFGLSGADYVSISKDGDKVILTPSKEKKVKK